MTLILEKANQKFERLSCIIVIEFIANKIQQGYLLTSN